MDKPNLREMYEILHNQRPGHPEGLGWTDTETMETCFDWVAKTPEVLGWKHNWAGLSMLDVGCGYGFFYGHCHQSYDLDPGEYFGVDLNPEAIRVAKQVYPEAHFLDSDVRSIRLHPHDWVVGIGTLSWMEDAEVEQMVKEMWSLSRYGIVLLQHRETTNVPNPGVIGDWITRPTAEEWREVTPNHIGIRLHRPDQLVG